MMFAGIRDKSLVLGILILLVSCATLRGVKVTLHNITNDPINVVALHVTGRTYEMSGLKPGERKSLFVDPTGDSAIEIDIESQTGIPKRIKVDCHLANGYAGQIYVRLNHDSISDVVNEISSR